METSSTARRLRSAGVAALAAVVGAAVFSLSGAGLPGSASAAPVTPAQAACPPPVDAPPISANTSSFAQISGIVGDATADRVRDWVTLMSVHTGVLVGSGLCGGAGKPAFDPVVLEKRVDRASVPLLSAALAGRHLATVQINVYGSGMTTQPLTYLFSDVVITSVRQVQRTDSLTEEVTLSFARVAYTYRPTNPDGSTGPAISFSWDVARNQGG